MDLGDVDLFAGIAVSEAAGAAEWYERLLGVPPTFWAHEREAVWILAEHRALYVVEDRDRAGRGLVTLMVGALDDHLSAAAARGVVPTRLEEYDGGVRKAVFHDPDGNEVGVGEVPAS
jgi:catechol 2,3-dioxygenase-like lactoylglutathione lyase family enzyme